MSMDTVATAIAKGLHMIPIIIALIASLSAGSTAVSRQHFWTAYAFRKTARMAYFGAQRTVATLIRGHPTHPVTPIPPMGDAAPAREDH